MQQFPKITFGYLFGLSVLLTSCSFPEREDPFIRLPEEKIETISGEIFPFSVSVATSATHRLEKDGKLAAYLASEIVQLADFEGQKVNVNGVRRAEKMREIFWVEAIRLEGVEAKTEEPEKQETRFLTKKFTFVYPKNWEYSLSPDGTAYFLDKNDPARRVFLTFSILELSKKDKQIDPNVLIANLTGIKDISTDEFDRERQEITLFSNISNQKYKFVFTHNFEEFEKKKSFFKLLNSFLEGEENVLKAKKQDLKVEAEKEAEKARAKGGGQLKIKNEESLYVKTSQDRLIMEERMNKRNEGDAQASRQSSERTSEEEVNFDPEGIEEASKPVPVALKDFVNLIDERAYPYESEYYKLSMKFPFGYWFRNFGPSETTITRLGAAKQKINSEDDVHFWIEIIGVENPPRETTERQEEDRLIINWPRTEKSFFRATGATNFRDAMLSTLSSIQIQ